MVLLLLLVIIGLANICCIGFVIKDASSLEPPFIILYGNVVTIVDEDCWLREQDVFLFGFFLFGLDVGEHRGVLFFLPGIVHGVVFDASVHIAHSTCFIALPAAPQAIYHRCWIVVIKR